jgi:hypothetical protein
MPKKTKQKRMHTQDEVAEKATHIYNDLYAEKYTKSEMIEVLEQALGYAETLGPKGWKKGKEEQTAESLFTKQP